MLALHRCNTQGKKKKIKDQSLYLFYLNLFQMVQTKSADLVITSIGSSISLIIHLWVEEKAGNWTEITLAW